MQPSHRPARAGRGRPRSSSGTEPAPAATVVASSGVGFCANRAASGTAGVGMFGATVNARGDDDQPPEKPCALGEASPSPTAAKRAKSEAAEEQHADSEQRRNLLHAFASNRKGHCLCFASFTAERRLCFSFSLRVDHHQSPRKSRSGTPSCRISSSHVPVTP